MTRTHGSLRRFVGRAETQDDPRLVSAGALGAIAGCIAKAANDLEEAADMARAHGYIGAARALETYVDGLRNEAAWLKRREE